MLMTTKWIPLINIYLLNLRPEVLSDLDTSTSPFTKFIQAFSPVIILIAVKSTFSYTPWHTILCHIHFVSQSACGKAWYKLCCGRYCKSFKDIFIKLLKFVSWIIVVLQRKRWESRPPIQQRCILIMSKCQWRMCLEVMLYYNVK